MPAYPRIAAHLYAEPWQITPAKFEEIAAAFEKARAHPDWQAADDPVGPFDEWNGKREYDHPQIEVYGGVALARVHGVTGKGLSRLAMMCGGFDTGLFREQIKNVTEDPTIKALVIDFNSPGGMAAGNIAVARDLQALSAQGVRVIGYASKMMCSAAYFMACGCDELHADPDAIIGSISTITSGEDNSAQWAMQGRKLKLFATGKFKATGMDGKEWTQEEEDMIWQRVRTLDSEFKGYVTSRRPGITADSLEGQWWYAKHAAPGLIDSTTFDNLSALLESVYQTL